MGDVVVHLEEGAASAVAVVALVDVAVEALVDVVVEALADAAEASVDVVDREGPREVEVASEVAMVGVDAVRDVYVRVCLFCFPFHVPYTTMRVTLVHQQVTDSRCQFVTRMSMIQMQRARVT